MKNKNLLRQNLFIFATIAISWGLFFFNILSSTYVGGYFILWAISIIYSLFFIPLAYLQYSRLKKNINTEKLNKTLRIINCVFMAIFALLIILELWTGISGTFYFYGKDTSLFVNIYGVFLNLFHSISLINLKDVSDWAINSLPFLVVIILFYLGNKFNKKIEAIQ